MAMRSFRLRQMEQYILDHDTVSMEQLCELYSVSMNTARLDVAQLVEKGTVKKVYGGVCRSQPNNLVPFEERKLRNLAFKRAIGLAAAHYVEEGDVIYIDSGSTTLHIIGGLAETRHVTVVTNNLDAVNGALRYPNLDVICLAGRLERNTNSFIASDTVQVMKRYNIRKAFLAATGISQAGGVTNSSLLEFEIKKAAVENSEQNFLLIDSTKFGRTALMTYATLDQIGRVITDRGADEQFLNLCAQFNLPVDQVGEEEPEERNAPDETAL